MMNDRVHHVLHYWLRLGRGFGWRFWRLNFRLLFWLFDWFLHFRFLLHWLLLDRFLLDRFLLNRFLLRFFLLWLLGWFLLRLFV